MASRAATGRREGEGARLWRSTQPTAAASFIPRARSFPAHGSESLSARLSLSGIDKHAGAPLRLRTLTARKTPEPTLVLGVPFPQLVNDAGQLRDGLPHASPFLIRTPGGPPRRRPRSVKGAG
jgi:hypothetical protein